MKGVEQDFHVALLAFQCYAHIELGNSESFMLPNEKANTRLTG